MEASTSFSHVTDLPLLNGLETDLLGNISSNNADSSVSASFSHDYDLPFQNGADLVQLENVSMDLNDIDEVLNSHRQDLNEIETAMDNGMTFRDLSDQNGIEPDIFDGVSTEEASIYFGQNDENATEPIDIDDITRGTDMTSYLDEQRRAIYDLQNSFHISDSDEEPSTSQNDIQWTNCVKCRDTFFDFYTCPCMFCKGGICTDCYEKCSFLQIVENRINFIKISEGGYVQPFGKLYLVCGERCVSNLLFQIDSSEGTEQV